MKKISYSKKAIAAMICTILAAALLAGCASSNDYFTDPSAPGSGGGAMDFAAVAPPAMPMPEADMMYYDEAEHMEVIYNFTGESRDIMVDDMVYDIDGSIEPISAVIGDEFAEKIIYSVYADIETKNFDETIENVRVLMERFNAFIESSSISGVNYASRHYGWNDFRSAYFSLRVPKEHLNSFSLNLQTLGNVIHESSNAMNITSQFYDTQSRLNSLVVQESRLLDMLANAEDVPDLIMIEERLSNVRYQLESLMTTLNNWQSQVDYSTLSISIREVEEFTEQVQIHRTYWEQMYDGFMATIRNTGKFFMNLFLWVVVNAPVLIILTAIAVFALLIVKIKIRKNKKNKAGAAETVQSNTVAAAESNTVEAVEDKSADVVETGAAETEENDSTKSVSVKISKPEQEQSKPENE